VNGDAAWRHLSTWYQVSTQDQAIPPEAQRFFASRMEAVTTEVDSSHVAMVSHPGETAQLIKAAAEACTPSA
jgi:hypothetical protein